MGNNQSSNMYNLIVSDMNSKLHDNSNHHARYNNFSPPTDSIERRERGNCTDSQKSLSSVVGNDTSFSFSSNNKLKPTNINSIFGNDINSSTIFSNDAPTIKPDSLNPLYNVYDNINGGSEINIESLILSTTSGDNNSISSNIDKYIGGLLNSDDGGELSTNTDGILHNQFGGDDTDTQSSNSDSPSHKSSSSSSIKGGVVKSDSYVSEYEQIYGGVRQGRSLFNNGYDTLSERDECGSQQGGELIIMNKQFNMP